MPVVMWGVPSLRKQEWVHWAAPLVVVLGVGMNRFNSTLAAQFAPAGSVYVPSALEWASTLGIIAAAMLIWYLAVRFVMGFALKFGYEHH